MTAGELCLPDGRPLRVLTVRQPWAVGALEPDSVARPHPARAAQADARLGRWR